jgi:uncharacterized membrane protein
MPFGWPTLGRPIGRLEVGHPHGIFGVFSYYQLVMLFLNMVCLTVASPTEKIELILPIDNPNACKRLRKLDENDLTLLILIPTLAASTQR